MEETERSQDELDLGADVEIHSVAELTERISGAISNEFGGPVWVRGEISNYRGRNQKGHIYFNIKDEEAVLPCVFFARQSANIGFDLAEGLEVLVSGTLNVYAPHGKYQLVVQRLLPGGVGQLHIRFEQLKKKLLGEGLFDEARKRPLPRFPKVIGIVTSPTGAVIRDMLKILGRRYPRLRILIVPTQVQGDGAAASIVQAIETLSGFQEPKVDTIVLARGGGSIEDLWPFNEETVARAIFASNIPIVSAIGHETDFTISDFVADARAATPTHAAELVSPDGAELLRELSHVSQRLFMTLRQEVDLYGQKLKRYSTSPVLRFPEKIVVDSRQTLDRHMERLSYRLTNLLQERQLQWLRPAERLGALNPLKVLERGFALAETTDGKVVVDAAQLKTGDNVALHFARGGADARIEKLRKERS